MHTVEQVLSARKPRSLSEWEQTELNEHTEQCLECARATLKPDKYKRCEAIRVWMTEANAYTFEIDKAAEDCTWCKTKKQHEEKVRNQTAQNPELHRRMWEGVSWTFSGSKYSDHAYVRMQWAVSTLQVIVGHYDPFDYRTVTEELVYHTYSDCE